MAFAPDAERLKEVEFTYPPVLAQLKMIVPVEVEESRLFAFVRPFQPLVNTSSTDILHLLKLIKLIM